MAIALKATGFLHLKKLDNHSLFLRLPSQKSSLSTKAISPMTTLTIAPTVGLSETFINLKKQGKVAFIPYITAGDPDLSTTAKALKVLCSCGSDIIELGCCYKIFGKGDQF